MEVDGFYFTDLILLQPICEIFNQSVRAYNNSFPFQIMRFSIEQNISFYFLNILKSFLGIHVLFEMLLKICFSFVSSFLSYPVKLKCIWTISIFYFLFAKNKLLFYFVLFLSSFFFRIFIANLQNIVCQTNVSWAGLRHIW